MTAGLLSIHCIAFGVRFQLTTDSELVLSKMLDNAPFGTQYCARSSGENQQFMLLNSQGSIGYRFVIDDEIVAESARLQLVLDRLGRDLMVHVANHAPDRIFVHAGVVGWHGQAVVFPGYSLAGKTTLVAELVRAGAAYYSDEYAVLDEHGQVHPYPRDLQMRLESGPDQRSVSVDQLNGSAGIEPLPVSQVVFTEYLEHGHWKPEPVSSGRAVLEMLCHAIPVQRTPARVMASLAKMMETATAVRSERGEASEVARSLLIKMNARRQSV